MGIRMQDDPDFGPGCPRRCFPAGETPEKVYVKFQEIEACVPHLPPVCKVPPNDRTFVLDQDPFLPCSFNFSDANWSVGVTFGRLPLRDTVIELIDHPGNFYFFSTKAGCGQEGEIFHNALVTCPAIVCAHHGIAVVVWKPQAIAILESFPIRLANNLFMEFFPKDDGDLVYRFARKLDATNIRVLFTP